MSTGGITLEDAERMDMVERSRAEVAADKAEFDLQLKKTRRKWAKKGFSPSEATIARIEAQETTARCARCVFAVSGTLRETREAFAKHACLTQDSTH